MCMGTVAGHDDGCRLRTVRAWHNTSTAIHQQLSTAINSNTSTAINMSYTSAEKSMRTQCFWSLRAQEAALSLSLSLSLFLSLSLSDMRLRITIQKKSFFEISDTSAPHSRLYTNYRQRVVPNHRRVSASSSLSRASTTGGTSQVQQGLKKNSQKNTQTHTQQPTHPAPLADKCNLTLLPPALPPPVQYYTW